MRLKVLGSGDAFGSGGRFNTSFHLTTGTGTQILLDCGATAMVAMRRFDVRPEDIEAVLITHLHGDHFGGLPFLLLYSQYEAQRERPLTIAGPPGIEAATRNALKVLFGNGDLDWRFPLQFVELTPGERSEVAGVQVEPFPVVHSGSPCFALRVSDGERLLAYSGDTTWTDVLPEVARGADLFIMECYAYAETCPTHTDWRTLEQHLPDLAAKEIRLTHMNPTMLAQLANIPLPALEDGLELEL